jgi:hypothetical protein
MRLNSHLPRLALLALWLCVQGVARAEADEDDSDQIPAIGRPADLPFSGASGKFRVSARAEPVELEAETPLTFTLTVRSAGVIKHPPKRLDLRQLPAFAAAFHIEDGDDRHPDDATWEFTYRVKPRRMDVKEVPGLPFVYYDPSLAGAGKPFQVAYTDPIPLRVREHTAVPVPLRAPASTMAITTGPEVLSTPLHWPAPNAVATAVLVILPPAACLAWWIRWRRMYPDVARRTLQRRSRAARHALHALHQIHGLSGEPLAARAAAIMTGYLHERLDLSPREPTPAEVRNHLAGQNQLAELADGMSQFYEACDLSRFMPIIETPPDLLAQGERLILAVEGILCPVPS